MAVPSVITIAAYVFVLSVWTVAVTAYYTHAPRENRPDQ